MAYETGNLPLEALVGPVATATEALVRLDERLARSPVAEGWIARAQFHDAAAALWLEGELVAMEDLVLHDARMDLRTPTHELTRAHEVLRMRRRIAAEPRDWAFSREGLNELTGRARRAGASDPRGRAPRSSQAGQGIAADADESEGATGGVGDADVDHGLADAFAEIDAVLARSSTVLAGGAGRRDGEGGAASQREAGEAAASSASGIPNQGPQGLGELLLYDEDWDEQARLAEWLDAVAATRGLPAVLRAALALDAWGDIEVLQHGGFIGTLLAAALLRQERATDNHLACLSVGARAVPRGRRRARNRTERLLAFIDVVREAAEAGMREHDRLALARAGMEQQLKGRRASSRLPGLMEMVLSRPLVSTATIQAELKVSRQGVLDLVAAFGLREITGRGRYKAWGVV